MMVQKLTRQNIKETIEQTYLYFNKEVVDDKQLKKLKLLLENILNMYRDKFGEDTRYKFKLKRRKKIVYCILKIYCEKINPLDYRLLLDSKDTVIREKLYESLKITPTYDYVKDCNIFSFAIRRIGTPFRQNFKFCWKFMGKLKPLFVLAVILQGFTAILSVLVPVLTSDIIVAYTDVIFEQIITVAVAIFAVKLVNVVLNWIIVSIYNRTFFTVKSNLIVYVCNSTTQIKNYVLEQNGAGLFVRRLTEDVDLLSTGTQGITELCLRILNYLGILGAVFIVSPIAFVYIFTTLLIGIWIDKIRTEKYKKNDRIFRESTETYSNFIVELINGIKDIKLFNGRDSFIAQTRNKVLDTRDKGLAMYDNNYKFRFFRDGLSCLFDLGFMVFLGIALVTNFMDIDFSYAIVLFYYNSSLGPNTFLTLSSLFDYVRNFNLSGERILTLLDDEKYPKDVFGQVNIKKLKGEITAKQINFAYNHFTPKEEDINILKNVSFHIDPGQKVGIVGKTGSGKTTILNLIGKIYDVYDGELLFDEQNIRYLDEATIRTNSITISQNAHIFNMSVKDNLRVVKADITDTEIEKVCKLACIHNYVANLSEGYDTIVGENGIKFSGGERQRLAIARALIIKPPIIIFDESTSALDNITQSEVISNISEYAKDSTIIMVAHRLSTIKDADKILFVDKGTIVAEGTHKELLTKNDLYKELYYSEEK